MDRQAWARIAKVFVLVVAVCAVVICVAYNLKMKQTTNNEDLLVSGDMLSGDVLSGDISGDTISGDIQEEE